MARLVARGGPLQGLEFPLLDGRTVLGRGSGCGIILDDPSVSREHCEIRAGEGGVVVRDMGSKNGTAVNGVPVEETACGGGDLVRVGCSTFEIMTEDGAGEGTGPVEGGPEPATISLALRDPGPAPGPAAPPAAAASLARVAEAVSAEGDPARRLAALCDAIVAGLPAGRAAALLDAAEGAPAAGAARGRDARDVAGLVLPAGLLSRARAGEAVLTPDRALDPREAPAGARSLFCAAAAAPLRAGGRVVGVVYADTAGGAPDFNGAALEWLRAAGTIAGAALAAATKGAGSRGARPPFAEDGAPELIGKSPPMRRVFDTIRRVAATSSTVLLSGESGTGKELIARAIHANSPRRAGPLVAVNCAALPRDLVESELFGHERGAFTGALARSRGRFEQASGGTLLLDEVGDLPPEAQGKLLRALEERAVTRVGGQSPVPVDVRIVAATHRDLRGLTESGDFREDLYYRLSALVLEVPALRERKDDIPYLAAYFLERLREECGHHVQGFEPDTLTLLTSYPWPGNVRELRNSIERACVLSGGTTLRPSDFSFLDPSRAARSSGGGRAGGSAEEMPTLRDVERQHITRVIQSTGGNKSRAARILGIERSTLYEKLKALGL
ncbi:MAG: sigma 54-interacting transcriptional regulator [Planctomycetales bacterium]|nr:sigma 54-interacting transcriptional regulator [Planctomycetales bacterium]